MANTKSALKQWRASLRRRARNRTIISSVKTYVSKAVTALASSADTSAEAVRQAVAALDKAAEKGILHANNASRRKSRLMKRLNATVVVASRGAAEPEAPKAATRSRRTTAAGGARRTTASTSTRRRGPTAR